MKPYLKKVSYNKRPEALLLIVGGAIFCGLVLYGILTQSVSQTNGFIVTSFIFFASILIMGIWLFLKKNATGAINLNGWKYKLFTKGGKYKFILATGMVKSLFCAAIVFVLYLINALSLSNFGLTFKEILLLIFLFILAVFVLGLLEYKKYISMNIHQ